MANLSHLKSNGELEEITVEKREERGMDLMRRIEQRDEVDQEIEIAIIKLQFLNNTMYQMSLAVIYIGFANSRSF